LYARETTGDGRRERPGGWACEAGGLASGRWTGRRPVSAPACRDAAMTSWIESCAESWQQQQRRQRRQHCHQANTRSTDKTDRHRSLTQSLAATQPFYVIYQPQPPAACFILTLETHSVGRTSSSTVKHGDLCRCVMRPVDPVDTFTLTILADLRQLKICSSKSDRINIICLRRPSTWVSAPSSCPICNQL